MNFNGKRILVAGACGGLGRDLVQALLARGADVIAMDLRRSLEAFPPPDGVRTFEVDATDASSVTHSFDALRAYTDRLDGLVNLIGFARPRLPVSEVKEDDWEEVLDGNLTSAYRLAKAALPLLRAAETPSMVLTSSGLGILPRTGYGAYAVSKSGVIGLGKLLAHEWGPKIRVNAIAPAAVETAFLTGGTGRDTPALTDAQKFDAEAYVRNIPLGRVAQPDDITGPILFLLSDLSAYITGHTLPINGGMIMT